MHVYILPFPYGLNIPPLNHETNEKKKYITITTAAVIKPSLNRFHIRLVLILISRAFSLVCSLS